MHFFFGASWRAPLVLVVLVAFAGGLVMGALGMLPGWWKHRSTNTARPPAAEPLPTTPAAGPATTMHHGL